MMKTLHYQVHVINDVDDVLKAVRDKMAEVDRSSIKLLHFIYCGELSCIFDDSLQVTAVFVTSWWLKPKQLKMTLCLVRFS